ncbi:Rpn family recombination-promoting nuclease/putative transposase [Candidatus Mesenet endosymbiont of Agriotes lineatus]|uniref:Rpn family recombination-promoting nuclease/putative transposase n=1 Tax=Candidatus Mesenet endosymbiont of Agriotes lineatus TaxID=3077948 RepID=UPI0030CDF5CA
MTISKFLDARNDVAFKRIFGSEKNKDILIHFLNDILGFTGLGAIQEVEFLTTVLDPEIASKKQSIVDILCKDSQNIKYIVEMQFTKTKGFEKRAQYYAAKAYSGQADQGDEYHNLKEIIFVAVADCIIFPDKAEYKSDHIILDRNSFEHDLRDIYFTFIELPKFPKTKEDQLENIVEKWCYFFKYAAETREEDLDKIVGSDIIIKRAYEEMNKFNWSEQELLAYEQGKKRLRDEIAALAQKFDEGKIEGKIEGIQIGTEKGIQIGTEKGIQIGSQKGKIEGKIEVAKTMLANNVDVTTIVKFTGLPLDEIKKL